MSFELDPQVAATLAAIAAQSGPLPPPPPVGDVESRRGALSAMLAWANNTAQPIAAEVETTDHEIAVADGTTIVARWYRLPSSDSRAAVLYLHGGGMILGSVPIFDGPVSRYVVHTGVPMLSVEYRLAPEHPYPTPVEDAYAGLVWLAAHTAELDVDAERIAVMGDSAGGGLAAAVAILSRDRGGPLLARQILLYPMLDDRTTTPTPRLSRSPVGPTTTTSPAGTPYSASGLPTHRSTRQPPPPGSPTPPASHRPTSKSASSTSSAMRTSPTPSPSATPGYPSNSTCTPGSRTSTTPSRSMPTSHDAPWPTVTAS